MAGGAAARNSRIRFRRLAAQFESGYRLLAADGGEVAEELMERIPALDRRPSLPDCRRRFFACD